MYIPAPLEISVTTACLLIAYLSQPAPTWLDEVYSESDIHKQTLSMLAWMITRATKKHKAREVSDVADDHVLVS
jgi:hypothetical protein